MKDTLYKQFLKSGDTLWVYRQNKKIFTSREGFLFPLIDYISKFYPQPTEVTVLDRIMGNAAALLSVKALAVEVWSPIGSEYAINTLDKYSVEWHIFEIVPYIRAQDGADICPIEKFSISKDMNLDEFYEAVLGHYPLAGIKQR